MAMLLAQIFLLMLGAFLAGACLACVFRKAIAGRRAQPQVVGAVPGAEVPGPSATFPSNGGSAGNASPNRFERALDGPGSGLAATSQRSAAPPVVEVQAPAASSSPPVAKSEAAPGVAPAPEKQAAPAVAVAASATPAAQSIAIQEKATVLPAVASGPNYAELAVVAAATAAAAEAARKAAEAAAEAASASGVVGSGAPGAGTAVVGDDLMRIRAIDPDTKRRLNTMGVLTFADIAAWTASDVTRFNQSLGFLGRIERENWIEQASVLTSGGARDVVQNTTVETVAASVDAVPVGADRLNRIIGIDGLAEKVLIASGVTSLAQIANWSSDDVARVEALLGKHGRVGNENWIEQARFLSRSDLALSGGASDKTDYYSGLRSVRSEALIGDGGLSASAVPGAAGVNDLKRIRGIGVLIEKKLNALGVTGYEQVANWTGADIDRVSQVLDFKGRIEREGWVEQARILASGGHTEFSRRVDRGEI